MMVFEHDYDKFPELTNQQISDFGLSSPHPQITEDFEAEVVKVHDGDTVTLRVPFRDFDFPLRLLNIDAPELNAGGQEAEQWLRLRLINRKVMIKIDPQNRVGKYGRLLGSILVDGLNVGEEMLSQGLAKEFSSRNDGTIPQLGKIMQEGEI